MPPIRVRTNQIAPDGGLLITKIYGIDVSLIVNIYNRSAIAGNRHFLYGLGSEAFVSLCSCRYRATGGALLFLGLSEGVIVVIGILLPMHNGVLGVGIRNPLGIHDGIRSQIGTEGEAICAGSVYKPAAEGIAGLGGGSGLHSNLASHLEL